MVQRLMIINAVVFFGQAMSPIIAELGAISVHGFFGRGYLWQPFTYMWLHGGLLHIVFNMFVLWMFGGQLEQVWGSKRFLRFYFCRGRPAWSAPGPHRTGGGRSSAG